MNIKEVMDMVELKEDGNAIVPSIFFQFDRETNALLKTTLTIPKNLAFGVFELCHELAHFILMKPETFIVFFPPFLEETINRMANGNENHMVEYMCDAIAITLLHYNRLEDDSDEIFDYGNQSYESNTHPSIQNRKELIRIVKNRNWVTFLKNLEEGR
jgi:adenylate kinase family enzyme